MVTKCKRCGWEITKLKFSEEQNLEIWALIIQDMPLFAIKKMTDSGLSQVEAKGVLAHLNKDFGKCNRCDYNNLEGEYCECPQCKSFNYNLKIEPSFNEYFCNHLEWKLDFSSLNDEAVQDYWCDGVNHQPYDIKSLTKDNLRRDKFIRTNAWIGQDGQDVYNMTIHFGKRALECYENNVSLIDCIPDEDGENWIRIDPNAFTIEIQLY